MFSLTALMTLTIKYKNVVYENFNLELIVDLKAIDWADFLWLCVHIFSDPILMLFKAQNKL